MTDDGGAKQEPLWEQLVVAGRTHLDGRNFHTNHYWVSQCVLEGMWPVIQEELARLTEENARLTAEKDGMEQLWQWMTSGGVL